MKGLLLTDWYVARKNCKLYIGIIVLMSLLSLVVDAGLWYLFYPILFAGMIPVYILSIEEKYKWNCFAVVLPWSRQEIVTVKYIDALITVGGTGLLMTLLWTGKFILLGGGMGMGPLVKTMMLVTGAGLMFPLVLLPLMLRYGVEKGRYIMIAGIALAMIVVVFVATGSGGAPEGMENFYTMDVASRTGWLAPLFLCGAAVLFVLSWLLAVKLYGNREL